MNRKVFVSWFSIVGIIGIAFGIFYSFFGLEGFPAYNILIPKAVIAPWSNGLYGAVFIGFSTLLFFAGRHAFRKNDKDLMKALLYGILAWLVVEASFSIYYTVYFNVLVDILLALFLGFPLYKSLQVPKKKKPNSII